MQVDWDAKRPEIAACAAPPKATSRSDDLSNPTYCGWDDVAPIPSDDDPSWSVFGVSQTQEEEVKPQIRGGKKLTKEQRQKLKDEEQLREARESIRKRGWSENEVKWRSWLARRGRDVMVNDWNLSQYIDGECIPPSRDPFWLNANEKPLPDYEAGNDVENEEPEPVLTNLMGEVIAPKHAPLKPRRLKPLWSDVDGDALVRHTLGRKTDSYCWQQSTTQVHLELRVPEGTSARDCFVTMHPTRLCVRIGRDAKPILDEELFMRIYVGSNVDDDSSLWELQDKRVLVFHLTKWHRLKAGNVRDASRTWWRQCFVSETPFENSVPHNEYYNTREKR